MSAPASTRMLLRWALALFTITIAIGILNGTDLIDFDHSGRLIHLHAGTLGWITLPLIGVMLWMFDPEGADAPSGRPAPGRRGGDRPGRRNQT